jgi:anthranilate synthase component 1
LEFKLKIEPTFSQFKYLSTQGNVLPVCCGFRAGDETPLSTYMKVRNGQYSFLLESSDTTRESIKWGRYSFIGYMPFLIALYKNEEMQVWEDGENKILSDVKNPLDILRHLNSKYIIPDSEITYPFEGGLVGYFNYEMIRKWETFSNTHPGDNSIPEAIFMAPKKIIIFDHLTNEIKIIYLVIVKGKSYLKEDYQNACRELEGTLSELKSTSPDAEKTIKPKISGMKSNFVKEDFCSSVLRAKEYIAAGDAIQIVLSQKFKGTISGDDFELYKNLRSVNPSPYMFYLNFDETKLIGASPEILVRLKNRKIELRPIAGTRPRGKNPEEDISLEKDLLSDPKERAEHLMLVDLGRNDVGRVSEKNSVRVERFMEIEHYSHVMHLVSRVEGLLKQDMDSFDLFMSAFPAGTVTGAPKVRAMEIINELEPVQRGPYAGATGYFAFSGNMDFCITIRTICIFKNEISIQAGAGIVHDSLPEREYEETLEKAAAMFKAIERSKAK